MAFQIPVKRHRRSSVNTPVVTPSSSRRHLPPVAPSPARFPKRASSVVQSRRGSSAASFPCDPLIPESEAQAVPQQYAEIDAQEDEESIAEVVMAVDMRDKGAIGCCYYVAANEALYMMADISSAGLEVIDLRE